LPPGTLNCTSGAKLEGFQINHFRFQALAEFTVLADFDHHSESVQLEEPEFVYIQLDML